jgi:hypothetical protein
MSSLLRRAMVVIVTVGFVLGAALITTWAAAIYRSWPCTIVVSDTGSGRRGGDPSPTWEQRRCPGL